MVKELTLKNKDGGSYFYDKEEQMELAKAWENAKANNANHEVKALAELLDRMPDDANRVIVFVLHYLGGQS